MVMVMDGYENDDRDVIKVVEESEKRIMEHIQKMNDQLFSDSKK